MLKPILSWLFLLAMCQAIFLSMALLTAPQRDLRTANRLLSALLLLCTAVIGHAWLGTNHLYRLFPHSALAIVTLGLAVGPLLYLYLCTALSDERLTRRALLHFLPFGVATVAMLPFYLQPAAAKLAWMQDLTAIPWYLTVAAVLKLCLFMLYLAACYRLMRRVPPGSPLLRGLRQLVKIWHVGAVLSVVALGMELAATDWLLAPDELATIALILFVFATAFMAMRLPLGYRPLPLPPAPAPAPASKAKYANQQLSAQDRATFVARLAACMEQEQPYRDGELTLEALATRLALTPHELSRLINATCGTDFADYLNRHRVDALKSALHDSRHASASMLELALASGFDSTSAMNRVFEQHTGVTPGEFRDRAATAM